MKIEIITIFASWMFPNDSTCSFTKTSTGDPEGNVKQFELQIYCFVHHGINKLLMPDFTLNVKPIFLLQKLLPS